LPVSEWPEHDQTAWAAAERAAGKPEQGSIAAHWSDATWRMVRGGYGRWLTWLDDQGLLGATAPAERVTSERVSSYIGALRTSVGEFTVAARVEQLGNAMRVLAPAQHWH
jgi:hypothetical protein